MPSSALELLDGMLALDPSKRIDARKALESEWLRSVDPTSVSFQDVLPQHQDCHELWIKKRWDFSFSLFTFLNLSLEESLSDFIFATRRRAQDRVKEGGPGGEGGGSGPTNSAGQGVTSNPGSNSNTASEVASKENSKSPTAKQETETTSAPPPQVAPTVKTTWGGHKCLDTEGQILTYFL